MHKFYWINAVNLVEAGGSFETAEQAIKHAETQYALHLKMTDEDAANFVRAYVKILQEVDRDQ